MLLNDLKELCFQRLLSEADRRCKRYSSRDSPTDQLGVQWPTLPGLPVQDQPPCNGMPLLARGQSGASESKLSGTSRAGLACQGSVAGVHTWAVVHP